MKSSQYVRTRRQLLRVTTVSAASIPFLALARKPASAQIVSRPAPAPAPTPTVPPRPTPNSCFLKGTKIWTPSGDRPVQELQIGDEVQTLAGRKAIKWIGYNKFTKEEGRAWQEAVKPIRVARFAIDDHTPNRDLYLSALHCVYLNEALIPVMYLINEATIAQGTPSDMSAIEYYHIELDAHEVIYAEGASVESYYCDTPHSRETFSNFVEYERLYGVDLKSMTQFAPMVGYNRASSEIKALVRSLISNVVDVRDPIQIAYDQIAKRAEAMLV
jgi:hypothetical protein